MSAASDADKRRADPGAHARVGDGLAPRPFRAASGLWRAAALVALAATLLFGLLRVGGEPLPALSEAFAVRDERALGAGVFAAGDAQLLVREREATRVLVEVVEGEARFRAADPRALRVIAGDVRVEAAAAAPHTPRSPAEEPLDWTVRRRGATVEVEVERGRAALYVGGRELDLPPGQRWSRVLPWYTAAEAPSGGGPPEGGGALAPPPGAPLPPALEARSGAAARPASRGEGPAAPGDPSTPDQALRVGEGSADEAPPPAGSAGASPPRPQATPEQAAAAFTALLQRREAGAPADAVLRDVDRFRARWPGSPLDGEAELLRLDALGQVLPVAQATRALDAWLDTHPQDPRRAVVLFVAARVAAERAGDCGAAARYLRLVEAEGSPAEAERARRERRSCGR